MLGSRIELLLVDDDEIDRELVCRLLSSEYVVSEAATAEEALAAVDRFRPDCVLLDYRLPGGSGVCPGSKCQPARDHPYR